MRYTAVVMDVVVRKVVGLQSRLLLLCTYEQPSSTCHARSRRSSGGERGNRQVT